MLLDEKETEYIIKQLEHRSYRIGEAIRKVKDAPWQYIDDVSELTKERDFVLGIIDKLSGQK